MAIAVISVIGVEMSPLSTCAAVFMVFIPERRTPSSVSRVVDFVVGNCICIFQGTPYSFTRAIAYPEFSQLAVDFLPEGIGKASRRSRDRDSPVGRYYAPALSEDQLPTECFPFSLGVAWRIADTGISDSKAEEATVYGTRMESKYRRQSCRFSMGQREPTE